MDGRQDTALALVEGVADDDNVTLAVLDAVHRNHAITQRTVSHEIGIALGLTNAYLKRCIKKGYVKITHAPRNRYLYYLTPEGFAAKARLTSEYLSQSFLFFRAARSECNDLLAHCERMGLSRIALAGASELAEILVLCAADQYGGEIVAVVDPACGHMANFAGRQLVAHFDALPPVDAVLVSDLGQPQATFEAACRALGEDRVLAPPLLKVARRPQVAE